MNNVCLSVLLTWLLTTLSTAGVSEGSLYKMSEEAATDLSALPEAGKNNENSSNGNVPATVLESVDKSYKEKEREKPVLLVEPALNGDNKVNTGVEIGNSEVEYIESENLNDVEDVDTSLKVKIPDIVLMLACSNFYICHLLRLITQVSFQCRCISFFHVLDSIDWTRLQGLGFSV